MCLQQAVVWTKSFKFGSDCGNIGVPVSDPYIAIIVLVMIKHHHQST